MKCKGFFLLLACTSIFADELWLGQTFPMVEKNAILEIQKILIDDAPKIKKKLDAMKKQAQWKIKNYRPKKYVDLPICEQEYVWYTELEYENEFDNIPNVPIGTKLYPLRHISIPFDVVVLNAKEKKETDWLLTQDYKNILTQIWITNGSFLDYQKNLNKKIYYYNGTLQDRIKLNCTPSKIKQVGNTWKITEYKL